MLTIGLGKFAESESEIVDSLFDPAGSADGIAKRSARAIHLHRLDGTLCGVVSSGGVIGAARVLDDGRRWYSYGDCPLVGPLSCTAMADAVRALAVSTFWDRRGELRYRFK